MSIERFVSLHAYCDTRKEKMMISLAYVGRTITDKMIVHDLRRKQLLRSLAYTQEISKLFPIDDLNCLYEPAKYIIDGVVIDEDIY
jgi:hypothetical protein